MKILSLDVATSCGYATGIPMPQDVEVKYGLLNVRPRTAAEVEGVEPSEASGDDEPEVKRHWRLYVAIRQILLGLCPDRDFSKTIVMVEGSKGFVRGNNSVKVANELRGVVKLLCGQYNVRYVETAPTTLKKFATGYGGSKKRKVTKEHMIAAAKERFGYRGNNDDEADALIQLHYGLSLGWKGLIQKIVRAS